MDLDSMKYAELRNLAKELGLKANMKADKLLKLLKQHYQQENNNKEEEQARDTDEAAVQEDRDTGRGSPRENKEEGSSSAVFVNTRRGRRNGTKRKISHPATETEGDAELPPAAAEEGTKVAASAAPGGIRGAKKRKVSPVKDSSQTEPEPPKKPQAAGSEQQKEEVDIKNEAPVHGDAGKANKVAKAGKIPRLQQRNKQLLKPVTPNFKKLHEAHFNKMESIDSYVQRKTKQMETYRDSVKELKKLSDKTKLQHVDVKSQAKANHASLFSPVPLNKRQAGDKRRNTVLSASKPAGKEDAPFRPSVLSTRRINVRFSEATPDNEYKMSLVKTPARMSPCVASSTPQKTTTAALKTNNVKTSVFSATKTPAPFVFTGNTSTSATPGTQKKSTFDLKASLSRPLSYKPHKGKLKPFGETNENPATALNKSANSNTHQKNYKQHQVQTREDRRAKQITDRKQKKENMLGARRGLVMM